MLFTDILEKNDQRGAAAGSTWRGHLVREYRGRLARAAGFTLAEIMIAIMMLGIGLAMVTALFPAALKQTAASTSDVVGTIICHNGLNIVKAQLRQPPPPSTGLAGVTTALMNLGDPASAYKTQADQWIYPMPVSVAHTLTDNAKNWTPSQFIGGQWIGGQWKGGYAVFGNQSILIDHNTQTQLMLTGSFSPSPGAADPVFIQSSSRDTMGFTVLARHADPNYLTNNNYNDYQFVVVSYQKQTPGSLVAAKLIQAKWQPDPEQRPVLTAQIPADGQYILKGSPVIIVKVGVVDVDPSFATVEAKSDVVTAVLDHAPPVAQNATFSAFVIYETDPINTNIIIGNRSPVMTVLSARTSLPPQ